VEQALYPLFERGHGRATPLAVNERLRHEIDAIEDD